MQTMKNKWHFWLDRGGTFTDIIAVSPQGETIIKKTLSENTGGGLQAVREVLGLPPTARIPASRVAEIRIGTTIATNALLERKGEKTALAVSRGFADALLIGNQTRPHLFELNIIRAAPLWHRVVEINERLSAHGKVVRPLNEAAALNAFERLKKNGIHALAIVLMHGFRYPKHEKRLAILAKQVGFSRIITGYESAPFIKFIPRAHTTAADAYLSVAVADYSDSIRRQCEPGVNLLFMQSNGDLANTVRAVHTVLSGPAGGMSGMRQTAKKAGFACAVGFDMGGTSTDVALNNADLRLENIVAGVPLFAPMIDIHTIAAGGGSIVRHQDGRLLVGPQSAGAYPGPACYRNGGPLTITDCNVLLGKLRGEFFPAIFGKDGKQQLDEITVQKKFNRQAKGLSAAALAEGFLRVAVENMAGAIRRISVARGTDPRNGALVSFGGAAGQHACALADAVGIRRVIAPRHACVLSAWGIGMADIGAIKQRSVECSLSSKQLTVVLNELAKQAAKELPQYDKMILRLRCRYEGVDSILPVVWRANNVTAMRNEFEKTYKARYGYQELGKQVIVAIAEAEAKIFAKPAKIGLLKKTPVAAKIKVATVVFGGRRRATAFYDWRQLSAKMKITGPAVVLDDWNTVVVDPQWLAVVADDGDLLLSRNAKTKKIAHRHDPAMIEVFNNRFTAIAEQMGEMLRNTATSVNIRERLDFSCALFDGKGNLVANAPHMPVHLGSMSESVRAVLKKQPAGMLRGDVFMLNSPYEGGTHLPDITLIRAGRLGDGGKPDYFVAARGHHADIGGISPASMPADSRHIDEEGVLLPLCRLTKNGKLLEKETLHLLNNAVYPARSPAQNIADLRAQIASLAAGEDEMQRAAAEFSGNSVKAFLNLVQKNAEQATQRLLKTLKGGQGQSRLDDGSLIQVNIKINNGGAVFDFRGSSGVHPRNFNAPQSVARAAVIYSLRTLLGEDMPLNDGLMKPVRLLIPPDSLLNAHRPSAVAAGNVETSQNIVDAILTALGVCAAAQGTCNNFTVGFVGKQYYETVCGGMGAGKKFSGANAVQVHMTNSRASDPEVLEWNYPLRLEEFAFRRASGGRGYHRGGNGAIRRLCFLADGEANILSSHRKIAPVGIKGGDHGKCGQNAVRRKNGKIEKISGCAQIAMKAGDEFIIKTPGGGGYGKSR